MRKLRSQAAQAGTLGSFSPGAAPWGARGGYGAAGQAGAAAASSGCAAPVSSQPPSEASVGSDAAATDGSGSQVSFAGPAGAFRPGPHAWNLPGVAELAADAQEAEVLPFDASGGEPPAAQPDREPTPVQLEGIDALTAFLVGPVRNSLMGGGWGDQLTDPSARAVVRDLMRFVWSEHGTAFAAPSP